MPTEFKIPELGENVEKGDVVRILVKAGDTIAVDQPVLELETDKATIEVPSTVAGLVSDVKVKAGEKVKVGQVVLLLESAGADQARSQKPSLDDARDALSESRRAEAKSKPEEPKPEKVVDISAGRAAAQAAPKPEPVAPAPVPAPAAAQAPEIGRAHV